MKLLSVILMMGVAVGQTPGPVAAVPRTTAGAQWRVKFFYDKNDSAIDFRELVTPSPGVVCAFGVMAQDGRKPRGVMVTTVDGAKSWQTVKLPDLPVSADFLDAKTGWLVTSDAVHRTQDGGQTWQRAAKLKGVLRVKFLTAQRGFAVGFLKSVWQTVDGGTTWSKVAAAVEPTGKLENTVYNTIAFRDAEHGIITGYSRPPRRDDARAPPWMDPETQKRQVPNLTLVLETQDGGKTWKPQVVSAFGQVVKSAFQKIGLALMDYSEGSFAYGSEVINLSNSKTAFADKEKAVKDIGFDGDGRAWMAGIEVPGKLNQLPIPGKVMVMQSIDYQHWFGTPVDYRAVALRPKISFAGTEGWLATDGGMILRLESASL